MLKVLLLLLSVYVALSILFAVLPLLLLLVV